MYLQTIRIHKGIRMNISKLTITGANSYKQILKNINGIEAGKTILQHQKIEKYISLKNNRQQNAITLYQLSRDMIEIRKKQAVEAEVAII